MQGGGVKINMKFLVTIPMDEYNNLVQRCDASRPEYEMLKNGLITRDHEQRTAVELLCEVDEATFLLDLASQIYPDAAVHIQESISRGRQPEPTQQSPRKAVFAKENERVRMVLGS
jgi:hypothetical protein